MKVALLVATVARTGVETHLKVLARGLAGLGVTPMLVCPQPGPLTEDFDALGFEVRAAAPRRRFGGFELPRLARALADADLVHAHGPRALYWSALVRAARRRRPAVGTVHEFRLTGHDRPWRASLYGAIEVATLRAQDRLIAVSNDLRRRMLAAGVVAPERVVVIPNTSAALFASPRPLPASFTPRAVIAARLERVKGVDVLLDAWAELARDGPPPSLLVLGDGVERPALEARARALGLAGCVRFAGAVPDAAALMANEGFYVAPSRMEGLPGAVVEAMALGLPVVATAVGGHRDLLDDVAPEWLVPPEDARAFADRVRALLFLPATARDALARCLQDAAYARYAPARIAQATLDVYRSIRR